MENNSGPSEFNIFKSSLCLSGLREYLEELTRPCYETDLFKVSFPGRPLSGMDTLELYRCHFVLFNALYKLKSDYHEKDRFLYVHFMRTFLCDYPPPGRCWFYDDHNGFFCAEPSADAKIYCAIHSAAVGDFELDELSACYFYEDESNFYRLDSVKAGAFIKGAWVLLKQHSEYLQSLRVLDLPESADIAMIRNKFKKLAVKYHPDKPGGSKDVFCEINNAYRLLLKIRSSF